MASQMAPVGLCCHLLGNGQNTILACINICQWMKKGVTGVRNKKCLFLKIKKMFGLRNPSISIWYNNNLCFQASLEMWSVKYNFNSADWSLHTFMLSNIREAVDWWGWCFRPGWKAGWRDVCGPCRMSGSLSSDRLSGRFVAPPVWF